MAPNASSSPSSSVTEAELEGGLLAASAAQFLVSATFYLLYRARLLRWRAGRGHDDHDGVQPDAKPPSSVRFLEVASVSTLWWAISSSLTFLNKYLFSYWHGGRFVGRRIGAGVGVGGAVLGERARGPRVQ